MPQVTAQLLSSTGEVLASVLNLEIHLSYAGAGAWAGSFALAPHPPVITQEASVMPYTLRVSNGLHGTIYLDNMIFSMETGQWHIDFQGVGALTQEVEI